MNQEALSGSRAVTTWSPIGLTLIGLLLAVLLVGIVAARRASAQPTVKIVVIESFSGALAPQGYDALSAANAAIHAVVDSQGRVKGHPVELEALDDGGDGATAVVRIRAAATDPQLLGMLCCSTAAGARMASAALSKLPGRLRNAVRFPILAGAEGDQRALDGTARLLRPRHPLLIDAVAGRGSLARSAVARWPGMPVVRFRPDRGDTIDAVVEAVTRKAPDLLVLDADAPTAALLLSALRQNGFQGPVVGPTAVGVPELVGWLGPALTDVYVSRVPSAAMPPGLAAAFQKARGHAPAAVDVLTYDAVRGLLTTLTGAGTPPPIVRWTVQRLVPGQYPGIALPSAP